MIECIKRREQHERVPALLARFADAARGLIAIHRAGLAHRDFKPDNVLVGVDGRVRVVDFGLARSVGEPSIEHEPMSEYESGVRDQVASELDSDRLESMLTPEIETMTGTVLGTPTHMSPEQAAGAPVAEATDAWGLGALLHEALTGRPPFLAETVAETLRQVLHEEAPSPARLRPEVPRAHRFRGGEIRARPGLLPHRPHRIGSAPGGVHMDHRPGDKDYAWTQIGATEHGNPYWATKARRTEPEPERPRRGAGS